MSFEAERKALEGYFKSHWTDPAVLIFDNTNQPKPEAGDIYLTFRLVFSDGRQAELGAKNKQVLMRYDGLLQIDIMVPAEKGTAIGQKLADKAADILRRQQILDDAGGQITFKIPQKKTFGVLNPTDRFRVALSIPYIRDVKQ